MLLLTFNSIAITLQLLYFVALAFSSEIPTYELADDLLSKGKYSMAIKMYSEIIQAHKNDYLGYYKRATAYLALSKYSNAIKDYETVNKLNPAFENSYEQRASLLLKQGDVAGSKSCLDQLSKINNSNIAAKDLSKKIVLASALYKKLNSKEQDQVLSVLDKLINITPRDYNLIKKRSDIKLKSGRISEAVADLRFYLGSVENTVELNILQHDYAKLSSLQAIFLYDTASAMKSIKSCLKSDPDNVLCSKHHRELKKIVNNLKELEKNHEKRMFNTCFKSITMEKFGDLENVIQQLVNENLSKHKITNLHKSMNKALGRIYSIGCTSSVHLKKFDKGLEYCSNAILFDPNDVTMLLNKATIIIEMNKQEMEESGTASQLNEIPSILESIKKLLENNQSEDNRELVSKFNSLQNEHRKLKTLSERKDYYKILGVTKNASQKEIKKAYRKLAHKHHPDRASGKEKEAAEKAMAEINLAYEILGDPKKKEEFDNGFDPNDPNQGNNGFHQGGGGFGGFGGNPFFMQNDFHFGGFENSISFIVVDKSETIASSLKPTFLSDIERNTSQKINPENVRFFSLPDQNKNEYVPIDENVPFHSLDLTEDSIVYATLKVEGIWEDPAPVDLDFE
ncbi:hypothetical protein BB559_001032 [Furculomyces boomerangus]|uniref:J domain-containing protein n=1 Tax=Furculomyces boomerangus TaxID=61424 RepID=A0A2T9Z3D9_9FUNG|nr:hypothetical protein BB559_001032 [Furculomyces boomerangus]